MEHTFYDVKTKSKVTTKVVDKVAYSSDKGYRYALEGRTEDGRRLLGFVNKATWDAADV
jgi:hypothetical protein